MQILQDLNVDLHTHSTASDGSVSPSQLVFGLFRMELIFWH